MRLPNIPSFSLTRTLPLAERIDNARETIATQVQPGVAALNERKNEAFPQTPSWRVATAHLLAKRTQIIGQKPAGSLPRRFAAQVADIFSPSKDQRAERYLHAKNKLVTEIAEQAPLIKLIDTRTALEAAHAMLNTGAAAEQPLAPLKSPYDYAHEQITSPALLDRALRKLQAELADVAPGQRTAAIKSRLKALKRKEQELLKTMEPSAFLVKAARSGRSLEHIRQFPRHIALFARLRTVENALRADGHHDFATGLPYFPGVFAENLEQHAESQSHRRWSRDMDTQSRAFPQGRRAFLMEQHAALLYGARNAFTAASDRRVKLALDVDRLDRARAPVVAKDRSTAFFQRDRLNAVSDKERRARLAVYAHRRAEMIDARRELEVLETLLVELQLSLNENPGIVDAVTDAAARLAAAAKEFLGHAAVTGNNGRTPAQNDGLERQRAALLAQVAESLREVRSEKDQIGIPPPHDIPSPPRTLRERIRNIRMAGGHTIGERVSYNARALRMLTASPRAASRIANLLAAIDRYLNGQNNGANSSR